MPAIRRANPALVIFGNPPRSEMDAWAGVETSARHLLLALGAGNLGEVRRGINALRELSQNMRAQLRRGIHANPGGRRTKIGDHVQAVLYVHTVDGEPYVHGFGNADLKISNVRDGDVKLKGLHDTTGVCMYGEPDGSVTLEGDHGQPLWKMHQV